VEFDPMAASPEPYRTEWMYTFLPRGDHPTLTIRTNHCHFVTRDFRQGIRTYYNEDALCVFGQLRLPRLGGHPR
jgi:hypothetical protein